MYEFMCGGVPFGENASDPMNIYKAIINEYIKFLFRELNFPKFVKDQEFKKLMGQMLNKNSLSRLSKLYLIKENDWFKDFNWKGLDNLDIDIPYIPKITKVKENSIKINFVKYLKVFFIITFRKENLLSKKFL